MTDVPTQPDEALFPAPTQPAEVPFLTSDQWYSVPVAEHTDETKVSAARWLFERIVGDGPDEAPKTLALLVSEAERATLRPHTEQMPEDVGCFCEDDEGWWCQDADGPAEAFWQFDRTITDDCPGLALVEINEKEDAS